MKIIGISSDIKFIGNRHIVNQNDDFQNLIKTLKH